MILGPVFPLSQRPSRPGTTAFVLTGGGSDGAEVIEAAAASTRQWLDRRSGEASAGAVIATLAA